MAIDSADVLQILEALGREDISIEEANRRVGILETEPTRYHCGTCRFFKGKECCRLGQPAQPEHSLSVRCGAYEYRDPRSTALPPDKPTGSRMFK